MKPHMHKQCPPSQYSKKREEVKKKKAQSCAVSLRWIKMETKTNEAKPCPDAVLTPTCSAEVLNKWIRVFITETKTQNGENHPPRTLYSLLTGVLRHMRAQNPSYPNFLDTKNPVFSELRWVVRN